MITCILLIYVALLFLCWGSFLNVLSYRLIAGISIINPSSHCVVCKHPIAWFDNIPVISWIMLRGSCRSCHHTISCWYPILEIGSAFIFSYAWLIMPHSFFYTYFIFISALLITIRSDFQTMLISRFTTLAIIPVGYLASFLHFLPISFSESFMASVIGFGVLYAIGKIFTYKTGVPGVGQGDLELLATIGAFTGISGMWCAFTLGSFFASIYGVALMVLYGYQKYMRVPFGPFLALASLAYLFGRYYIIFF